MDSRSYIKLTGNLTEPPIFTGSTGSTITTGETTPTLIKKINLGGWNMNSSSNLTRNVSSGVPLAKVLSVDAIIKSDGGELFKIQQSSSNWESAGYVKVCNTPTNNAVVAVAHNDASGSFFRQSAFDNSVANRGWVIVTYSNIQPPTMVTGNISNVSATTFNVNGSIMLNNGGSDICEYGVLWSQVNSNPTITTGTKVSTFGSISAGVPFNRLLTGLQDSTDTYFRSYARNCEETGYGVVKQQMTCTATLPLSVAVGINALNNYGQYSDGFITVNPPLGTGQCVEIQLNYNQSAENVGDVAELYLCCSTNGGSYVPMYPFIPEDARTTDYSGSGPNYFCGVGSTSSIWLCKNDCICFVNQVNGGGGFSTLCSSFCVHVLSASPSPLTAGLDSCWDNLVSN